MQEQRIACHQPVLNSASDIKLNYICPYWGQEHLQAEEFIDKVIANEFDGIEINLPDEGIFSDCFIYEIEDIFTANPNLFLSPSSLPILLKKKLVITLEM